MQGMFSEEHQWGDISKSSPIARKKGYRNTQNNSSSACQNIGTQKKCLISSGPFCNITSASARDSRNWRLPGGMDYFINEPPWLQCPRPPWSRAEGLSTTPSCAWQRARGSWSPHSAKQPLLKYLPHSGACSSSFPGCLWMGQFAAPPPLAAFEHPLTFASETDAESLRPEAYCGPQELSQNQRQCHVVFSSAEISRALAWKRGEHLHTDTLKMPTQSQAWELQACQGRIIPHVEKQMKSQKERKKKSLINQ